MLVRLLYAAAALLAAAGAFLLTWATAYRPPSPRAQCVAFSTAGPFRYVRNPQYISYFLLMLALGTFQSRLGFPVMLLGEALLLLRLVAREELLLDLEYGHSFRAYAQRVPRLLPFLRRRIADDGKCTAMGPGPLGPSLPMGLRGHPPRAFAFTLTDPVGYTFAGATLLFLVLQKLIQPLVFRLRRT
jgi:hypothetical protein